MTVLSAQIEEISKQVNLGRDNQEHKLAIDAYDNLLDQFQPMLFELKQLMSKRSALNNVFRVQITDSSELIRTEIDKHSGVAHCFREFLSEWDEREYLVKQSNSVTKFSSALQTYYSSYERSNIHFFSEWLSDVLNEVSLSPEELAAQRDLPGQKSLVTEFKSLHQRFSSLTKKPPDEKDAIEILRCVEELKKLKGQMDFNFPEEVAAFFKALNSPVGNGAPISLLTDSVIAWLKENDQNGNYVIKRIGYF